MIAGVVVNQAPTLRWRQCYHVLMLESVRATDNKIETERALRLHFENQPTPEDFAYYVIARPGKNTERIRNTVVPPALESGQSSRTFTTTQRREAANSLSK